MILVSVWVVRMWCAMVRRHVHVVTAGVMVMLYMLVRWVVLRIRIVCGLWRRGRLCCRSKMVEGIVVRLGLWRDHGRCKRGASRSVAREGMPRPSSDRIEEGRITRCDAGVAWR